MTSNPDDVSDQDALAEGHEPGRGAVVEGLTVYLLVDVRRACLEIGRTAHRLRDFEGMGLPAKGSGPKKRYPLPHLHIWFGSFVVRSERGVVERLPFRVALADHRAREAETEVQLAEEAAEAGGHYRARRSKKAK